MVVKNWNLAFKLAHLPIRKLEVAIASLLVLCLLSYGFITLRERQRSEELNKGRLSYYQKNALPAYILKANEIKGLLMGLKSQEPQIERILNHISRWQIQTWQDVSQVEEVNSYLDTYFSSWVHLHHDKIMKDPRMGKALKTLEQREISLMRTRETVGLTPQKKM